ncbi:hhH-GPD superbase excision DNA repair family protein [Chlamydia ibidis 10-1398/6]|nr:hhH-GPD superbase excision DNA repair family protein [Chlamydia ibidis 10-1398/6]
MASLELGQLYTLIAPCGLGKRKSKYIHDLSNELCTAYEGIPPKSLTLLSKLPGVGRKTASVFLGIAHKITTFPVDTHILRLAQRWGITEKRSPLAAEKDLRQFFRDKNSPKLHLQLIYYARKYCPALRHNTKKCKICSFLYQDNMKLKTSN